MSEHNLNLFAIPVKKVSLVPTDEQYSKLDLKLTELFSRCTKDNWAQESGKSTGELGYDLHLLEEMQWLVEKSSKHVLNFWNDLSYHSPANIGIDSSWANQHMYGDYTGEHCHCGGSKKSHISAVYYFKKPPTSGNILFVDPLEYIHRMSPIQEFSDRNGFHEIVVNQFEFLLFPSWLKHKTQVNTSNQERIAMSLNYVGYWN